MFDILKKQKLVDDIYLMQIKAPDMAKKAQPGQFIILQIDEKGERVPFSIADIDAKSITIIFAVVGKTTNELAKLKKGNQLLHFAGPLGNPTEVGVFGEVCIIGGGFGIAPIYPIVKAMKKFGNRVTVIIGVRNKKLLFWEDNLRKVCDELIIVTNDGSAGEQGLVTDALEKEMKKTRFKLVFCVGPLLMMQAVSEMTKNRVRTVVSLNSIMLDGTGMCGSCRVNIGGETKFACVDGPEFNGHAVDWKSAINRDKRYKTEEKHVCKIGRK